MFMVPNSTFLQSCAADINHFAVLLSSAASSDDRANIIRYCSHICSIVSDVLEVVVPDGVSVIIK